GRQQRRSLRCLAQVVRKAVLVIPLVAAIALAASGVVDELHAQAGAQHRLGTQHVDETADGYVGGIEVLGVGQEAHGGAGVALSDLVNDLQLGLLLAPLKAHAVKVAAALDLHFQPAREGIDHGYTDAVQTAGEAVALVGELAAGVQAREDQFHAADLLFRVDVHRHAAAIVTHLDRAVLVQHDLDVA